MNGADVVVVPIHRIKDYRVRNGKGNLEALFEVLLVRVLVDHTYDGSSEVDECFGDLPRGKAILVFTVLSAVEIALPFAVSS